MSKKKNYDCHFQDEWLTDQKYIGWLQRDPKESTKAYCKQCMKTVSVARKGKANLDEHAKGQKHKSKVPCNRQTLFSNTKEPQSSCQASVQPSASVKSSTSQASESQPPPKQQSIDGFILNDAVIDAEIYWILETVAQKYSYNSNEKKKFLFAVMFQNSDVAKRITCGSTKSSDVVNFGIAPYFRSLLEESLKFARFYVSCFDESHNDVFKKGQMDMYIRFWKEDTNMVETRYYNTEFLGKAAATDIYEKFKKCLSSLDPNKMIQVYYYYYFFL